MKASQITSVFMSLVAMCASAQATASPREVHNWTRVIGLQSNVPGLHLLPFYVESVGEIAGHLSGSCRFFNHLEKPDPKTIGVSVRTDGEELYALVELQVANDVKGPWTTIGVSAGGSGKPFKIKIDPEESSPQLKVDLETYRSFIGKYRFGRLALWPEVGAIFELDDLRAPKEGQ